MLALLVVGIVIFLIGLVGAFKQKGQKRWLTIVFLGAALMIGSLLGSIVHTNQAEYHHDIATIKTDVTRQYHGHIKVNQADPIYDHDNNDRLASAIVTFSVAKSSGEPEICQGLAIKAPSGKFVLVAESLIPSCRADVAASQRH